MLARDGSGSWYLKQRRRQPTVPWQEGQQEGAGAAAQVEDPAMPAKVVRCRQRLRLCRPRGERGDSLRENPLLLLRERQVAQERLIGTDRGFELHPARITELIPEA